jgi:hypothetical protein
MQKISLERRVNRRYEVRLPVHYRVSPRGFSASAGTGTTREISTNGLSFRCRRPLPVGSHIELVVDWPAKYGDVYPIDLLLTGFVVRSDGNKSAVRITSRRFRVMQEAAAPYLASA